MTKESRKIDIKLLSYENLVEWLIKNGEKKFRAKQILKWIYQLQCDNFYGMNNLNKKLRNVLHLNFSIDRLKIKKVQVSIDGSKKYVFILSDNNMIESVLIPEKKHFTLCISSQVGCAQKCKFCMTAKGGFIRNLTCSEIIAQVRDMQREVKKQSKITLFNVVFMGMGEPLANYEEVIKAIRIISSGDYGLKIAQRRITISTAGIVPKIKRINLDAKVNLAVSLNASDNNIRNVIMPINKIYPLEDLVNTCRLYRPTKRQRVTFEYVMIKGINDTKEDAKKLINLLANIKVKINLIPFNEYTNCQYRKPTNKNVIKFQKYLLDRNFTTTIRYSKGKDISGACGQLKARYSKEHKMEISTKDPKYYSPIN